MKKKNCRKNVVDGNEYKAVIVRSLYGNPMTVYVHKEKTIDARRLFSEFGHKS